MNSFVGGHTHKYGIHGTATKAYKIVTKEPVMVRKGMQRRNQELPFATFAQLVRAEDRDDFQIADFHLPPRLMDRKTSSAAPRVRLTSSSECAAEMWFLFSAIGSRKKPLSIMPRRNSTSF